MNLFSRTLRWGLTSLLAWVGNGPRMAAGEDLAATAQPLVVSVYATATDVLQQLAPDAVRAGTLARLRELGVTRVFLEGRRGDEYVPPATLAAVRDRLAEAGLRTAGGIATVPGSDFGIRQDGPLGWLNWEAPRTRRDVAGFFTENAPVFSELIVDDFYCTGDTSAVSQAARAGRPWSVYRRDLLVSQVAPTLVDPARRARPDLRLIIKFPQWYDRFHLFGYDPERMAACFDSVWVGTEVRNPLTRRMGFVQPTEGYMNFRWLSSVCGPKTAGAWFDHIECTAENFVDQAFQSVLAGARELTLFRLGDVVAGHPGDALLVRRLPELRQLALRVQGAPRRGMVFYKPPNSEAHDNLYLADYLGMLGLPVLPEARFPERPELLFLGAQAAADPEVVAKLRSALATGTTCVVTPAFLRQAGPAAQELAGVAPGASPDPAVVVSVGRGAAGESLPRGLEVDGSVTVTRARLHLAGTTRTSPVPLLTERRVGRGRLCVLNVRTFSDADFQAGDEWLLSPARLGWPELPAAVANPLRRALLGSLRVRFEAPAGVGLHLFAGAACLYNFRDEATAVRFQGARLTLPPHDFRWIATR
jgi:hypothetical protein